MRPTPEAIASLARFKRDSEFFQRHQQEFLEQYPEQWIAIFNERLVGVNNDYMQLLEDLKIRGFPIGQVLKEFLTKEEEYWELEDFA